MPLPGGIVGTTSPRSAGSGSCSVSTAQSEDAEAHDADQRLHQLLEAAVAAEPDEREAEQAVRDGAPRLRDAPPVRLAMPRPVALVSAALTATVQNTR